MYFTDIFIRRPVFATVLSLVILLVGWRSFNELSIRQYPNIQPSVISVNVTYPGATAKLMEGFVTTPLEGALGSVEGIDFMNSSSTTGMSTITLEFKLGYDLTKAIADVSNAVSSVRYILPKEINDPIISKNDPNARPIVYIGFSSKTVKPEAINDYILRVVQPQFQAVDGVSQSKILGERQYAMRLWLDPARMAAHNMTTNDVMQALTKNNIQAAPGQLKSRWQQIDIRAHTDLNNPEDFNQLVLKNDNNYLIRLNDIGHAELGVENDDVSINMNGNKNAVVVGIIGQPSANPLDISKNINKIVEIMQANAPAGVKIEIIWDTSKFIAASLAEVRSTIFEATLFVVIVIFLFLGSLRSVFIPVVTIPLSIIGVCGFMLAMGYTINTLSLLAWVLAIGLVVDDAIVVLENIHRHIEEGKSPYDASLLGAREIGFAVIAMTLTLASVYAPIGFMGGIAGTLFREFAFTLAASVVISGFIALTLSPMMCSKLLTTNINKQGFIQKIEELFQRLTANYTTLLSKIVTKRKLVVIFAGAIYVLCYFLFASMPQKLAPDEDQGAIMTFVTGPTSANLAYTEKFTNQIEQIYKQVPEMAGYGIINGYPNGVSSSLSFLVFKAWDERKRSSDQIIQSLFPQLYSLTGVLAFPVNLPALPTSGSGRFPIEFVLKTTESYETLHNTVQQLIARITQENPQLVNVDTDLKMDKSQTLIEINRNKANLLGVSMTDIASALNTLLAQPQASLFEMEGRSYYVITQLYPKFMMVQDQLNNINVRTQNGELIPLSNLVTINEGIAPKSLNHFQQLRAATITASTDPKYPLGDALTYLEKVAKDILPSHTQYDFGGISRQFVQASGDMGQTFLFAIIFIFLVLAAQFESFRAPLIVMISVPLSLTGALIAMFLTSASLNVYTQIGLVTLIGLITKHGILIVEFANQIQAQGKSLTEAVIEAASLRLRPILMTTAAMLLGALPLAIAGGAGANARRELGWVIIGGMSIGTLFTLFIIPTVYTLLASKVKKHDTPITNDH